MNKLTRTLLIQGLVLISISCPGQEVKQINQGKKPRLLNIPYVRNKPLITYDGENAIVTPSSSTNAIVNPGKGWAIYGSPASQPPEVMEIASLGYTRYRWGNIEPEEGVYKWESIDKDINAWKKAGKDFSFGIACASTHSLDFWVTPKWVFDAGAKYDTFNLKDPRMSTTGVAGLKLVPVFDDPVFLKKLDHFIRALAARYDGNPNLAFIDIRSYGNWGEGHMYPFGKPDISAEKLKEHIMIHRNAFHKTLLILPWGSPRFDPVYEWAVSLGIGIRRDGICGNSNGSETSICSGKMPGVFEFFGNYEMMEKLGWWYGKKDDQGRGFRLDECVETGMPTYCDLSRGGQSGLKLLKSEPELVAELTNRIGYHFVLIEAIYPRTIISGKDFSVFSKWENRGVTQIYIPSKVAFALISTDGKVLQVCDAAGSIPSSWKSDTPASATDKLIFSKISPGNCKLAVGICRPGDGLIPSIKLGIEQKIIGGWYELGPVRVN
jgi:hypothetical protein